MSQLPDSPRRFVAGAKCPQCQAVDKVVMYRQEGVQYRECVSCGYRDNMVFEQTFREIETRVNLTAEQKQADLSVVRLINSQPNE
jgi:hypothetical protein